jgi:hypothetical protein
VSGGPVIVEVKVSHSREMSRLGKLFRSISMEILVVWVLHLVVGTVSSACINRAFQEPRSSRACLGNFQHLLLLFHVTHSARNEAQ